MITHSRVVWFHTEVQKPLGWRGENVWSVVSRTEKGYIMTDHLYMFWLNLSMAIEVVTNGTRSYGTSVILILYAMQSAILKLTKNIRSLWTDELLYPPVALPKFRKNGLNFSYTATAEGKKSLNSTIQFFRVSREWACKYKNRERNNWTVKKINCESSSIKWPLSLTKAICFLWTENIAQHLCIWL